MQAELLSSIADIERGSWDRLFGPASEGFDYYRACELAPPSQFRFSAIAVHDGDTLIAGAPLFRTDFRLDMMLEGRLRALGEWVGRRRPSLVEIPVVGAGSPHADELALAFHPDLDLHRRRQALAQLLDGIDQAAASNGESIVFLKNVTDRDSTWASDVFVSKGYSRMATLPIASLDVPASDDAYIAGLSANMRSNMRRKLKKAARVRVEVRTSPDGVEEEINNLRELTRRRAAADYDQFTEVSPHYFRHVMRHVGDRARLLLYWRDDMLLGFALVLIEPGQLREKYNGMRYPEGPDNGVFFLNWMTQVRMCVELGIPHLHAGETTYLTKARLGCRFHRSWIYYRHRGRLMNRVFRATSGWMAIDSTDPDLRKLGRSAPYAGP